MKRLPLLLLVFTAGCVTTSPVQVAPRIVTSYTLGEPQTATTGSQIVEVGRTFGLPTFTPAEAFLPPAIDGAPRVDSLEPGHVFVAGAETERGYILQPRNYEYARRNNLNLHIGSDGRPIAWLPSGVKIAYDTGEWPEAARFVPSSDLTFDGSFKAELVYMGKTGDALKLLYREYLEDLLRPAFSQEVEYNLAESNVIKYKSLTIEVDEATPSEIRYTVVSDEGLPWLPVQ